MSSKTETDADVEKGQWTPASGVDAENQWTQTSEFQSSKSDEEACSKLWDVYISEAKRYDLSLLEGWKKDMDGMLLFSALYSASLTAFIIESYKTLQDSSEVVTLDVLTQIAQGMASISNGTAATFNMPPPFQSTPSALVCNVFWFLSLALALTCSLLATFVQQWTRDFIHKVNMRPSSVASARILAYSYLGLRRFGMHTFVDVIPVLLHVSLLLFFAGLVGFLQPVNTLLMYVMAGFLAVFIMVYFGLSIIPLVYFDSPYRTPFSDILWRFWNATNRRIPGKHRFSSNRNLNNAIVQKSAENSAIPEVTLKPGGVRDTNATIIYSLIQSSNPAHNLISRISNFIAQPPLAADPAYLQRSMTISFRALWSLAYYLVSTNDVRIHESGVPVFWFDRKLVDMLKKLVEPTSVTSHRISALALVRTSRLQSIRRCVDEVAKLLHHPPPTIEKQWQFQLAKTILDAVSMDDIHWDSKVFKDSFSELRSALKEGSGPSDLTLDHSGELLKQAQETVARLQTPGRWKAAQLCIMGEYLTQALRTNTMPLEVHRTGDVIRSAMPSDSFDTSVEIFTDEAVETYAPLQAMALPPTGPQSNTTPTVGQKLFVSCLRLFFASNHALSLLPGPKSCRAKAERFLGCISRVAFRSILQEKDSHVVEKCIIQDLQYGAEDDSDSIRGVEFLYNTLTSPSVQEPISPRLQIFAHRVHEILTEHPHYHSTHRMYGVTKAYTQWILCHNILHWLYAAPDVTGEKNIVDVIKGFPADRHLMKTIQQLGKEHLVDYSIPEQPTTPWSAEQYRQWKQEFYDYMVSLNVVISSNYINACVDSDSTPYMPFNVRAQKFFSRQTLRCYPESQLAWAKSTRKVVSSYLKWNHSTPPRWKVLYEVVVFSASRDWLWITDTESAKILLEAVELHMKSQKFGGMIIYEPALLNRCQTIIQNTGS
ncbi:hypothetical protein D9758_009936 [Tetrapyrgos nigripes]|uniref:DUF6535 domain-containing protein n=1 Tax=Tetrapyrgos nigripes TaxID=182062 RepID=A0A8H5FR80_9AGAR|nr:hypothetical protein D9758_009936 [Tetrapyrgos nigripes]